METESYKRLPLGSGDAALLGLLQVFSPRTGPLNSMRVLGHWARGSELLQFQPCCSRVTCTKCLKRAHVIMNKIKIIFKWKGREDPQGEPEEAPAELEQ